MSTRADRHRNPTAFTTDLAHQAGLIQGVDYAVGDPFADGRLFTAVLLSDPIETTLQLIDKVGFYAKSGGQRWIYIALPEFVWASLCKALKIQVIGFMYKHEGGVAMLDLFKS